jgi:hypothetical protein
MKDLSKPATVPGLKFKRDNPGHGPAYRGPALKVDREWAVDHSRRKYRVRPSVVEDHSAIACGALILDMCIAITRIADGKQWILAEYCTQFPHAYEDSDGYCAARINRANEAAPKMWRRT